MVLRKHAANLLEYYIPILDIPCGRTLIIPEQFYKHNILHQLIKQAWCGFTRPQTSIEKLIHTQFPRSRRWNKDWND